MKRSIITLSITAIIIAGMSMTSLLASNVIDKSVVDTATNSLSQADLIEKKDNAHHLIFDEFSEPVTSVDLEKSIITLESGAVIQISGDVISGESDYASLEEVSNALSNGTSVTAEGTAALSQTEEGEEIYIAETVTFIES